MFNYYLYYGGIYPLPGKIIFKLDVASKELVGIFVFTSSICVAKIDYIGFTSFIKDQWAEKVRCRFFYV
jgi:hypothetical protein